MPPFGMAIREGYPEYLTWSLTKDLRVVGAMYPRNSKITRLRKILEPPFIRTVRLLSPFETNLSLSL